jgi:hypothetical protein
MPPSVISYAVGATVTRADIPGLCADLAERMRGRERGVVICEVGGMGQADVVAVEALARLRLTARRHGWRLLVSGACPELVALVRLVGLAEALPQVGRQAEDRKQPGCVQEVVEGGDPPA